MSKTRVAGAASGAVSVTTASTTVVSANPLRRSVRLQNDHASQVVYLALSETSAGTATAVANSGFRLLPVAANEFFETDYTGHIAAISVGGTSVVLVEEV